VNEPGLRALPLRDFFLSMQVYLLSCWQRDPRGQRYRGGRPLQLEHPSFARVVIAGPAAPLAIRPHAVGSAYDRSGVDWPGVSAPGLLFVPCSSPKILLNAMSESDPNRRCPRNGYLGLIAHRGAGVLGIASGFRASCSEIRVMVSPESLRGSHFNFIDPAFIGFC
jgi:hypothetical protein